MIKILGEIIVIMYIYKQIKYFESILLKQLNVNMILEHKIIKILGKQLI